MNLEEFREDLINDIKSQSLIDSEYPQEVFIDYCKDILINDFGILSDLDNTFIEYKTTNTQFRNMRIDASYLELSINTIHLLISDFNDGEMQFINKDFINQKALVMENFIHNTLKGYFKDSADSNPITQVAREIVKKISLVKKLHLIIISTNKKSEKLKTTIGLKPVIIGNIEFNIDLTLLDIEGIFETKSASFKREDIVIQTKEYGIDKGIPCIKADINAEDYDSYLAIVPGKFLANIYLQYSARLLESNVRSFLNTRGEINKGILNTILYNKSRFFAYNNGIATIAEDIKIEYISGKMFITEFKNLQIINGGQTTASLAAAVIKNNADLSGIFVQMKLSLIKDSSQTAELIRLISKYANKQNKVTNADLNSNHPFYTRIEEFSRKIKTPISPNSTIQTIWFFERARGQYEQAKMKLKTKNEREKLERLCPKAQKITKTDLAKYINASEMRPFDVAWGAEVNMTKFQIIMEKEWDKSNLKFNEEYFKELIAKAILFKEIEKIISNEEWYQNNKGYRAQLVPYTFSKFVYEVKKLGLCVNYRRIWEKQSCLEEYKADLANIAKIVYDILNDPNRQILNIGEYAKREMCWNKLNEIEYILSAETKTQLITKDDKEVETRIARADQRTTNELASEIEIFKLGSSFWEKVKQVGSQLGELNSYELQLCEIAIKYCLQQYLMLTKKQAKEIWTLKLKMDKYLGEGIL